MFFPLALLALQQLELLSAPPGRAASSRGEVEGRARRSGFCKTQFQDIALAEGVNN